MLGSSFFAMAIGEAGILINYRMCSDRVPWILKKENVMLLGRASVYRKQNCRAQLTNQETMTIHPKTVAWSP